MYESFYLNKCLQHLQEKLRWGISKSWTNKEFEKLSEQIFDASRIYISVVTLKRLFGRAKTYKKEYNPQLETKNALALFLGYTNWDDFKIKNNPATILEGKTNFSNTPSLPSGHTVGIAAPADPEPIRRRLSMPAFLFLSSALPYVRRCCRVQEVPVTLQSRGLL